MLVKKVKRTIMYQKYISQLYKYEETPDYDPDYLMTVSIYREVKPKHLISLGKLADNFIKVLIDLANGTIDNTITTNTERSLPENLTLLKLTDYCKYSIFLSYIQVFCYFC